MNPLDFSGPVFLAFYALACVAAGLVVRGVLWMLEQGPVPKIPEVDPYLMAGLREGEDESVKVAAMALLERGLLRVEGKTLTAEPDAKARVRRPIEKAILEACASGCEGHVLLNDGATKRAAHGFTQKLRELGLLPSQQQRVIRFVTAIAMVAGLWILAGLKIDLALSRGRTNIHFLVMEALVVPIAVARLALASRRTAVGGRVLADMQTLFSRLRGRADALASDSYEAALLAGVYGFGAAGMLFHQPGVVFAQPPPPPGSGGDSSSGSSCSSSCGGGCGGGCGGCGG